jgi:hypothetical protein
MLLPQRHLPQPMNTTHVVEWPPFLGNQRELAVEIGMTHEAAQGNARATAKHLIAEVRLLFPSKAVSIR